MKESTPHPLTDPIVPAISSIAVVTAVSCGLFEAFRGTTATVSAAEIASCLNVTTEGVVRLANVLVSLGYLQRDLEGYRLSPTTREAFLKESPRSFCNWGRFGWYQIAAVLNTKSVLQSGRPIDLFAELAKDKAILVQQRAMAETARLAADWVADAVPELESHFRMLDVGGSHGVYSAALCSRFSPMHSDVLELPDVIAAAKDVADECGTAQYCTHIPGDVRVDAIEGDYDLVFLGNLVHHFDDHEALAVLSRIAKRVRPGGVVALWDIFDEAEIPDLVSASFSLLFFVTSHTRCFSQAEVSEMLLSAGLSGIRMKQPFEGSTHRLVTARKDL